MTRGLRVAVASNFHMPGGAAERVFVSAEATGGSATEECSADPDQLLLLFALPGHLRSSFWSMMGSAETNRDFDAFAAEVGRFLTFKQIPAPECAIFELILHGAKGTVEPENLWAVVNLGEDPVMMVLPDLSVRLGPGEGCRLPETARAHVAPPTGEVPDVLLLVRRAAST